MKNNNHIVTLCVDYFDLKDRIFDLTQEAKKLKDHITSITKPGRYSKYSIRRVAKTTIHVREHTRKGYVIITRKRT